VTDVITAWPTSPEGVARADIGAPAIPDAAERTMASLDDAPSTPAERSSRLHAHTRFGGLMYLLWLVEPAGVLEAVGGDRPLAQRGLRWVLRQIALQLASLEAEDAVLDAFTGTIPDSREKVAHDEPPTPSEAADIAVLTNSMVAFMRERLLEPAQPRERLLDTLCRRHADIQFESGWIELHFRLDAASIAIRRSGLDRDPGWIPWLGTVVKFAYV
jgi:hypothetical protein